MKIVMFGAPNSGKGTISGMLSKHYEIPHLSTGNMFRQLAEERNELGFGSTRVATNEVRLRTATPALQDRSIISSLSSFSNIFLSLTEDSIRIKSATFLAFLIFLKSVNAPNLIFGN